MTNLQFYDLYCEAVETNEKLTVLYNQSKKENQSLRNRVDYLEANKDKMIDSAVRKATEDKDRIIEEKDQVIDKQAKEIARLTAMLNNDANNSGIPTSKTPIQKKKRVPNSRKKSGRKRGSQPGHKQHKLERFEDDEVDTIITHEPAINTVCPECGSDMVLLDTIVRDEYRLKIIVEKVRHVFNRYKCGSCGHIVMAEIPQQLSADNQYGIGVQAVTLSLLNEGMVSINRTKSIISGLTRGEIDLSEGYIAKLQKRLASYLGDFENELTKAVIGLKVVCWDDTVIDISTNRACLRFYGDDRLALFKAHMHKDKAGLEEDGILSTLDENTIVVHDHNIINYNDDYVYQNAECCVHLIRDLQKVIDNLDHKWAKEMINLLVETNVIRNEGDKPLDPDDIYKRYDDILNEADIENERDFNRYHGDTEKTLIKRMRTYKTEYLLWVANDEVPFSNNTSERALRGSKTKMKVSGQFNNLNTARHYALIRSYLETGKRFGFSQTELIERALEGNYVKLTEMMESLSDD